MGLKGKQACSSSCRRLEVVGREDLSLNDREIDFDLVKPLARSLVLLLLCTRNPAETPCYPGPYRVFNRFKLD